jgi:type I restriction enzyme M protein
VDNTPAPEPEDVQAHLIGGIPEEEVSNQEVADRNAAFGLKLDHLLQAERPGYLKFVAAIDSKSAIKATIEADAAVQKTLRDHQDALKDWWETAQVDFAQLRTGKTLPEVRQELLTTLKEKLIPLSVLDEFKSAGVFVNWWQQIRFDLKTIMATGWHHTLIPDDYLIARFFQAEADAIEALEATASEKQSELAEAVEAGQELCSYEPDEGETVTNATIKKALKDQIDDLKGGESKSAKTELAALKAQDKAIKDLEKAIKEAKAEGKHLTDELAHKLLLKRIGDTNFKIETQALLDQIDAQLNALDPEAKADKRAITALTKDKATLQERLDATAALLESIDGQLTEEQARALILKKLHDIVSQELERYLNAEKRALIAGIEKLWDKYAVSSQQLETDREATLGQLNGFLSGLGYLG